MADLDGLKSAAHESRQELLSHLRRVISDAEDLLHATADQSDGKVAELRARTRENLAAARDRLGDAEDALRDNARRAATATDDYVHDNPWSSMGAAAAVGMLIGVLLGRR